MTLPETSSRAQTVDCLRSRLRSLEWQQDDLEEEIAAAQEELYKAEHECPNCGEQSKVAGEPCSRRCGLHLEWAAELKRRREAAV